ncbi:Polycystin cation channel-domain-containing protein [Baffinella frigidus]|nr:Polycystin cation channel-domain-containing protein [Cryptophyta sp. CCMP2293]
MNPQGSRRGELNKCSVPGKYNEFFPYCFPPLSDEGKGGAVSKEPYGPYYNPSKEPYGPYYNPSKYLYNVSTQGTGWDDGGYVIMFPFNLAEGTGWDDGGDVIMFPFNLAGMGRDDGGYVIMFPFNLAESEKKLRELKSDRWLDESSQWLRIDFTTYNPSANLITQVEFILEREASGRLLPRFEAHVIKSEIYLDTVFDYIQAHVIKSEIYLDTVFDYIQIVLEILVFLSIVGYILTDSKDLCMVKAKVAAGEKDNFLGSFFTWVDIAKVAAGEKDNFLGSFFTWVDIVQILLFVISFIIWDKLLGAFFTWVDIVQILLFVISFIM